MSRIYIPFVFISFIFSITEGNIPFRERKKSPVAETVQKCKSMNVMASAYNSLKNQGEGDPAVTAWGDTLVPGTKSIAVSRDLIEKGLTYGTSLKIKGLEGFFIVNDKMHSRWRNKIDIYMGEDRNKALEWGRRKVEICFPMNSQ